MELYPRTFSAALAAQSSVVRLSSLLPNSRHTIHPRTIRLHVSFLHTTTFDLKGITLASIAAENCSGVEDEIKLFSEGGARVSEEANLCDESISNLYVADRCHAGCREAHTPLFPLGSRDAPQAFMLA